MDATVSLLYVADEGEEASGRTFLEDWATDHELGDTEQYVESGDVERVIERMGQEYSLVVLGATERGLLSRLVRGSVVPDVMDTLDTPVVLTEQPSSQSLWARLFARR